MNLEKILIFAEKAWRFASREDVRDVAAQIWKHLTAESAEREARYDENNANIVAKALHRMNDGRPPRIVLVGMTSAGKSSLVNALFGTPIAEVRRTPDTTSSVLEVRFPSGLTIFDTPGIAGNETYENVTRAFLGISQDPDLGTVSAVPYVDMSAAGAQELPLDKLRLRAPTIDGVLFVLDASRTLTRHDALALKSFYRELTAAFPGRVTAVGTHADALSDLAPAEREDMLSRYRHISGGTLIPVSTTAGTGLTDLVIALFRALPDVVSLSKMQESLTNARKLGRLAFVINEASNLLADTIFLTGSQAHDIHVASLCLFAMVCNHYSVDEATWMQHHGNAAALGEASQKAGVKTNMKVRDPKGFWEQVQAFFGKTFTYETREYERIGTGGLVILLPGVYNLLYEFSECSLPKRTNKEIGARMGASTAVIEAALAKDDRSAVAGEIRLILLSMLSVDSE